MTVSKAPPIQTNTAIDDATVLTVSQAQSLVMASVKSLQSVTQVALRSALGRVLAADIISPHNVPAHDNSAMDGFAFFSGDLKAEQSICLKIVGIAYAGDQYQIKLAPGECLRIMTGAIMPNNCDTVIPQEHTQTLEGDRIVFDGNTIQAGANRRFAGEDLVKGGIALAADTIIGAAHLGLLASLGMAEVPVRRRLRVAFFSTGDELRSIGQSLDLGCVYDSNRYTLFGMLTRLGCEPIDLGAVRDDPASLEEVLRSACESADAIITSGGVSVGAADYTRQIMARLGKVDFWQIDMRPGRPMAFGKISSNGKDAFLFGLPGNPVAVMVAFYFIARQGLLKLMGATDTQLTMLKVASANATRKKIGRTEYQRGIVSRCENGEQQVRITGAQGSGILRSMCEANCIVVLDDQRGNVGAGELVDIVLFDGLM